jgi:ParB family chromosome partitioning protein
MGTIKGTTKGSFFWFDPDDTRLVVITDPAHRLYDRRVEMSVDESMVQSISDPTIGILEPILVRKAGENYEVVDGRQRVRAAREAKRRNPDLVIRIPAVPRTVKDAEAARNSTIANVQRVEDSPSTKGENAARMLEMGYTEGEVVSFFGASFGTIKDWIGFSGSASKEVKAALDSDLITYTQARKISRMKHEKQEGALSGVGTERRRRGAPKGKRRRKICIVAYERDEGGFDVQVESKCRYDEFATIMEALDAELDEWKAN